MKKKSYLYTAAIVAFLAVLFMLFISGGCAVILEKQNQQFWKFNIVSNLLSNTNESASQLSFEGKWIGTNERDVNSNIVYKNQAVYNPPSARFRHYFIFEDDGTCPSFQLAPNDAHYVMDEDCSLKNRDGQEVFTLGDIKYDVIERTAEILVLKKQ